MQNAGPFLKRYNSVAPRLVSRAVCLNWFKERVRFIIRKLARQSFSRIKERVRYTFKWLDGSLARQSLSLHAEPPSQLNNISFETSDEPPNQLNLYSFKSGPVFCSLVPSLRCVRCPKVELFVEMFRAKL